MSVRFRLSTLFSAIVSIVFVTATASSQIRFDIKAPDGEQLKGVTNNGSLFGGDFPIGYTSNGVYLYDTRLNVNGTVWNPPSGSTIQGVGIKWGSGGDLIILVQPAGSTNSVDVYYAHFTGLGWDTPVKQGSLISSSYSESLSKLIGDALYIRGSSFVYVSRNVGVTWSIDTLGLNGAYASDIAMDTAQKVWAATSNGLYRQAPDTSLWVHVDSFKVANASTVFVDRKDRVYVSANQATYFSTDRGLTWTIDTAGIGTTSVNSWTDDAYGNVFALLSNNTVVRSSAGTGAWTSLQSAIVSATVSSPGISGMAGDTNVTLATSFGFLISSDQGTTWHLADAKIPASIFGGFAKSASGKWFTSTSLALFSKNPSDVSWTQTYPTVGFKSLLPLATDGAGNIYTATGTTTPGGPIIYKSTDNGTSWNPDTLGLSILRTGVFFVDELGGQHLATSQYGSSFPTLIYTKPAGGGWTLDTAGFTSTNYSFTSAVTSDRHGWLYISGYYYSGATQVSAKVMKRPIGGGTWIPDTSGLPAGVNYFSQLGSTRNGSILALAGSSLYRNSGGGWGTIPLPSQAVSNYYAPSRVSVDSSDAIFLSFTNFQGGRGVYFTSDTGATWTYAGLDSIYVNKLISYGDSTFASTADGLYILTRQGSSTSVGFEAAMPVSYQLFQNYPNPFNPTTNISYQLSAIGKVSLKIYDLLGREVATLVNGEMNAGRHEVTFDASRLASGIYFYRLRAGSFTATKKLLLLK